MMNKKMNWEELDALVMEAMVESLVSILSDAEEIKKNILNLTHKNNYDENQKQLYDVTIQRKVGW